MSIDSQDGVPGPADTPPAIPHTLTGIAGEDSIALTWEQDGGADFWTVYVDPLDGSPSQVYRATRRRFEVTDLPFGDHEIGVMSWRGGVPCPGPGVFLTVSVLGAPEGGPRQVGDVDIAATTTSVDASWEADADVVGWDVRLLAADWTVEQRVDGATSPWVSFSQLRPDTIYGVQVRARGRDGTRSRWSVSSWQRTRKVACGQASCQSASSVKF